MVVYVEDGVLYVVRWARKPYVISQGQGFPPVKLVAIRLAGGVLQVAVEEPGRTLTWSRPEAWLTEPEAALWAKKGFGGGDRPAGKDAAQSPRRR